MGYALCFPPCFRGFRAHFRVQSNEVISRIYSVCKKVGIRRLENEPGKEDFKRRRGGEREEVTMYLVVKQLAEWGMGGNIRVTPLFDTTAEAGKGVGISAVEASGHGRTEGTGTTF